MGQYVKITNLKGPKGDVGAKGVKGDTGTFASASAESIAAGEQAQVVLSGPENARHLHARIPRGLPAAESLPQQQVIAEWTTATDSTLRSALDRVYGKVLTVDSQGAVGDGVTDDTDAVRAALGGAAAFGVKSVYFAETYKTQSFTIPAGITATGPGKLIWHESSPAGTPFVTLLGHIETITLDGNRAGNPRVNHRSQDAIVFVHPDADGASVSNAKLLNGPSSAIWGEVPAKNVRVTDNLFRNCRNYNVAVRGDGWDVSHNHMIGGTNGVRIGSFLSEFQANPNIQLFEGTRVIGNRFYGTSSVPLEVEINTSGLVFSGNTGYMCNGITKIQYQQNEPAYKTVFSGNHFAQCGYPVTYDDATGVATQDTSGGNITPVPFGGFNTIVTNNIIDDVAGIVVENGVTVSNNIFLNIGSSTASQALVRISASSDGAVFSNNKLRAHTSRGTNVTLVRVDAPNVRIYGNDLSGKPDAQYLVSVYGANCHLTDNIIRDSAGSLQISSAVSGFMVRENTFVNVSAAFANVNRLAPRLVIERNTGGGTMPDVAANVDVVAGAIDVTNGRKFSIGSGADNTPATLTTLTGGQSGDVVVLQRRSSVQAVTVASGGNITLTSGNYLLDAQKKLVVMFDGVAWIELRRT